VYYLPDGVENAVDGFTFRKVEKIVLKLHGRLGVLPYRNKKLARDLPIRIEYE